MFGLRCTSDLHAFTKKLEPAQRTTGVASANSIHLAIEGGRILSTFPHGIIPAIAMTKTGKAIAKAIQNFLDSFRNSAASSSSALSPARTGSSGIPHLGQSPG